MIITLKEPTTHQVIATTKPARMTTLTDDGWELIAIGEESRGGSTRLVYILHDAETAEADAEEDDDDRDDDDDDDQGDDDDPDPEPDPTEPSQLVDERGRPL